MASLLYSVAEICAYNWKDELNDFKETFDIEFNYSSTPKEIKKTIDNVKDHEKRKLMQAHMLYHLCVIRINLLS